MEEIKLDATHLKSWQERQDILYTSVENLRVKKLKLITQFEKDNERLIDAIVLLSDQLELEKAQFRELAFDIYTKNKVKKLIGGLGIRVSTSIEYESDKAFNWAKEHSLCLQLDKKGFEKLAKAQDIEFVNKCDKVTVTFPKRIA